MFDDSNSNFSRKIFVLKFDFATIISVKTFMKGKYPNPTLWLTDSSADPGGPKTYGFDGSGTLVIWK